MTEAHSNPRPPKTYRQFIDRHPKLGDAWDLLSAAGAHSNGRVRTGLVPRHRSTPRIQGSLTSYPWRVSLVSSVSWCSRDTP